VVGLNNIVNYENMLPIHFTPAMPVSVASFYEQFNFSLEVCFRYEKTHFAKENTDLPM
jgi:hypothetical protein